MRLLEILAPSILEEAVLLSQLEICRFLSAIRDSKDRPEMKFRTYILFLFP